MRHINKDLSIIHKTKSIQNQIQFVVGKIRQNSTQNMNAVTNDSQLTVPFTTNSSLIEQQQELETVEYLEQNDDDFLPPIFNLRGMTSCTSYMMSQTSDAHQLSKQIFLE
ncbi:Hypothetical_protein [Hexamita inflata]|uniref:Hypothetical_protein n=1 Tax=Hexamita inflata TaxID=28002 RepID=A0AA86Q9D2_9EUKA|nr:Hypothetical protein HINF_LOCUS31834 [Hexamita inflata]CAI9954750.1 Hypothetical protein HINF_LOCUS42395 [Hexamita inflata]